jgi:AraC family transcriptional regulator, transcriptional activator of pobA
MFKTYTISHFLQKNTEGSLNLGLGMSDVGKDAINHVSTGSHFHINRLEDMPPLPAHIVTPHKHRFYELFLIKQGTATQVIDYQEYKLAANTFLLISQGQLHFFEKSNREELQGYRLMFTEEFFQMNQLDNQFLFEVIHLDNIYQNPFLALSPEANGFVFTYFDLLFQEYQRPNTYDRALQSLLFLLLAEIHRLLKTPLPSDATKHQATVFKQFIILLETHFMKKWAAANYAESLFISPRHLNRIVQDITNQSLTQVIQNRTVLEAKRLLTFTDLTVGQIAERLGFEDAAYFARCFRKETGTSPTDFKENVSQKYR